MKALTRLGQRRYSPAGGYSTDQARELAALSRLLSRQIGLVIDRQGRVELIIVGDASSILIPELPRSRTGAGRLRGLRLLHTHLTPDGLSHEDLMDLLFLRLDGIGVLTVDEFGAPQRFQSAHLLPAGLEERTAAPDRSSEDACRVTPFVPWDQVETDFAAETAALEEEWSRLRDGATTASGATRAVLVSVSPAPRPVQEAFLDELAELARTAGVDVTGRLLQRVTGVNPRQILGQTKLAELEVLALRGQASLVVFDGELAPAQLHNLTELTERKVLDRTQLILDIFAQHSSTRTGKLQVELARLKYTLPRLAGRNAGKSRAMDRLMGGIGGRGPGETKLETDRRRIRDRMTRIRKELDDLRRQRANTRARRERQGLPVAALVGYTNAGKSTLLNALTRSDVLSENRLFATLDPTTRRLRFPRERELVLADTVGFIRNLPKELIEAFRATLEELESADVLLHVADASHPEFDRQMESVESILADLELSGIPRLLVLNKWDAADADTRAALQAAFPDALPVSALTGAGLDRFSRELEKRLFDGESGAAGAQQIAQ